MKNNKEGRVIRLLTIILLLLTLLLAMGCSSDNLLSNEELLYEGALVSMDTKGSTTTITFADTVVITQHYSPNYSDSAFIIGGRYRLFQGIAPLSGKIVYLRHADSTEAREINERQ